MAHRESRPEGGVLLSAVAAPLRLSGVTRVYGRPSAEVRALDNVTLEVADGEVVVILGPSGSGKTTLLSVAGCLLRPTSGRVEVVGIDVTALRQRDLPPVRARHIGLVFQAFNLLAPLSAEENVLMPMQIAGVPAHEARERARHLLDSLGLAAHARRRPSELSGGEQQRVAIARALANRPDVILADEPTASLDSAGGARVMRLLVDAIRDRAARALVVVTHDRRVLDAADRVLTLEDGRLGNRT